MGTSEAPSRHPAFMRQAALCGFLLIVALILLSPSAGDAQVATDITSSGLNTQIDQVGNSYNVTGGTRPGNGPNLFHSFGTFSVGGGDTANFLNTTPALVTSNILGRVTGGNPSNIFGSLDTASYPGANLFLMNPSGFVFGPSASLNVGGSVSFTTAQYIRLFDGVSSSANFHANPANDGLANSILTVDSSAFEFLNATPAAYGFLTAPNPTPSITVQGSALSVPSGQSISLVGGKVVIEGGAQLSAPSGSIKLASAVTPGEFDVNTLASFPNVNGASFASAGLVSLAPSSSINVHDASTVWIRGGQLVLSVDNATLSTSESPAPSNTISLSPGSSIATSNSGTEPGADLHATVVNFRMDGSSITTVASGPGKGGAVQIHAGSLTLENSASIVTATVDGGGVGGPGGDIVLNVRTASLMGGSSILSLMQNSFPGSGQGGNVTIQGRAGAESGAAESVALSGDSSLSTQTFGSSEGGRLAITSKSLTMDGTATSVNTQATGVGRGGDIVVSIRRAGFSGGATILTSTGNADPNAPAAATVTVQGLSGAGSMADSVEVSGSGSGLLSDTQVAAVRSGDVALHARTVRLTDRAVIQTGTSFNSGAGGNVTINAGSVDISREGRILSLSASGNAGQVAITADRLTMNNVSIESSTSSSGRGGDVALNVGTVSLSNGAKINSSTSETGRAGDVTMNVGTLSLANGSSISSASIGTDPIVNFDGTTTPPGQAGNIAITASGDFLSDAATITTSAEANRGGDISITAHNIRLSNGALINADSNAPLVVTKLVLNESGQLVEQTVGNGNAGNIRIQNGSTFLMEGSAVTTEAAHASGGQITINAPDMVQLIDSQLSTSVAGAVEDSNGGNILIDPQFVILQGSQILARAVAGSGGAIGITAGLFLADPSSIVDASSTLGVSGTVNINAPISNLSSVVGRLPESLLEVQTLLRAACAARLAQGQTSSFVERGRDGIPAGPDGLLASPYLPMSSEHSEQRQAKPSIEPSTIQLRRLPGQATTPSRILLSDNTACSS